MYFEIEEERATGRPLLRQFGKPLAELDGVLPRHPIDGMIRAVDASDRIKADLPQFPRFASVAVSDAKAGVERDKGVKDAGLMAAFAAAASTLR